MTQEVTLYSKPNCAQCNFTKKWLDDHSVEHTVIDASQSEATRIYLKEDLGFQSLPVVKIEGGEIWFGFNPDKLEKNFGGK